MNYWFIIHDLKSYEQHSDLIGCRVKRPGLRQPRFKQFAEIKKGDKIVYYATKNNVVGIFNVVSDITYLKKDPYWNEIMVYSIKPAEMPPTDFYLDFKKLILSKTQKFDLFPISEKWHVYLQKKTCRKLTKHDYQIIKNNLNNPDYLIKKVEVKVKETKWHREIKPEKEAPTEAKSPHDAIIDSLLTIGQIFGFESLKKPPVNDLRPRDKSFTAKDKVLDLAWKIGPTYIPFEVQVHGSIPDLIFRLNLVHQWSIKMVVVAEHRYHDEIREAAKTHHFDEKVVLLTPEEIDKAKKDYKELLNLRLKISP